MLRFLRMFVLPAGLLLAAWQLGGVQKLVWLLRTGFGAMTGRTAISIPQDARRQTLRSNLGQALASYRSANQGRDPENLETLMQAGFLGTGDLLDEWDHPLVAESRAGRLVVHGLGQDGKRGTADDWTLSD